MKKLKKLILPVILFVLLCAVCVALFINYRQARKFQPPINGISWGMTSDEVIKKLNLSEDNVRENEDGNIIVSYENATVFNQKANVRMVFDMQSKINLSSIAIEFQDLNRDDLINQLNDIYGQYVKMEAKRFPIWASGKVMNLPQEIQDRFKYSKIELPAKFGVSTGFSEDNMWESFKENALINLQLIDSTLKYDATYMAVSVIAKNDEKYNAWIEYIENLLKNRPEPDSAAE